MKKARTASAFVCGFIFAIGLSLSGMTQPQRIIAFLDITGSWDPTLLFVMCGAILTHGSAYLLLKRRTKPILANSFQLPEQNKITKPLFYGSTFFGIGWGLSGFCPGPAIVSLFSFNKSNLIFFTSLLLGMLFFNKSKRLIIK